MIVGIHQPNYLPWQGYFAKIAASDVFVFLDDAQFTKNSYINRVQVMNNGKKHWLTIPVSVHLGDKIMDVYPAGEWRDRHCATLENFYRTAPCFKSGWEGVRKIYDTAPDGGLAEINIHFIKHLSLGMGLKTRFVRASSLGITGSSDYRLADITSALGGTVYLSGAGGAKYQTDEPFTDRGITLKYLDFKPKPYRQRHNFSAGASILDAILETSGPCLDIKDTVKMKHHGRV